MPEPVGSIFRCLDDDVRELYLLWLNYCELFGQNADTVQVINDSAPACGYVIQQTLLDAIYLSLSRITDPAKSCGNDNLTFRKLLEVCDGALPSNLVDTLRARVDDAEKAVMVFRKHRNKRIAHSDLQHAMQADFSRPSRDAMRCAINACSLVLNTLSLEYNKGPIVYECLIFRGGGASLIALLREGLRLRSLRKDVSADRIDGEALKSAVLTRPNPSAARE